jgi:hypothetical protein
LDRAQKKLVASIAFLPAPLLLYADHGGRISATPWKRHVVNQAAIIPTPLLVSHDASGCASAKSITRIWLDPRRLAPHIFSCQFEELIPLLLEYVESRLHDDMRAHCIIARDVVGRDAIALIQTTCCSHCQPRKDIDA